MMNDSALHELPEGWVWSSIEDIGENKKYAIVDGPFGSHLKISDYIETGEIPVISISNIDEGFDDDKLRYISREKFETIKRSAVKPGDIIVAKIGSSYGKCGFYPEWMPTGIIPANLVKITASKSIDKLFVFYYLRSLTFKKKLDLITKSTAQPAFNVSAFRSLSIPFPPLPKQRAIVSKIEQLFSDLDNGIDNFKKAQAQLKLYRQSVLKAACGGKLVPTEGELARAEGRDYKPADVLLERILEERREKWDGKGKYKEPAAADTSGLPELPKGWVWVTVEQLNPPTRTCAYGVLQPGSDVKSGIPLVRVGDIKDGQINENKMKKISPQIVEKYSRTKLEGGEILITLVGAIGRTAVVPKSLSGANTARAVGVIPLNKHVSPFWINTWFQQAEKIAEMTSKSHEVARKTLNLEDVRTTLIGLPPFAEQYRIVAEVETRLSICNKMEETIAESLEKAESLRQSILKKAFEGKLLNEKELEEARNAPDWEPAEKLLERIRAEKKNIKTKNKGKK